MPGAIELRRGVEGYDAARPGCVIFGIDSSGNPVTIDDQGVMQSSATLDGSPLSLAEQLVDPTTAAAQLKLYAKRSSGVLRLFRRNESNGLVDMLNAGALNVNWKAGTPGNPYVNGDTANAAAEDMVMIECISPGVVSVQFPSATANPGKRIVIVNTNGPKTTPGAYQLIPATGESIGKGSVDQTLEPSDPTIADCVTFYSDGNGVWYQSSPILLVAA